jgi:N utilization substance protein B
MSTVGFKPTGRRLARVLALQALFEADLSQHRSVDVIERLLGETTIDPVYAEFARSLVARVEAHRAEIDRYLETASPTWSLAQMARVDRNILRIAVAEILFDNTVPLKAAINEAIELAKAFGSEHSPRFVNGVLGGVAQYSGRIPANDADPAATPDNA